MALRVAFDDLVRVHSELHDPESIGSVFWSADSVVALLANGIGFSIKRDDMGFVRISAPVGTPLHIVDGLRNMLLAFQGAAPDRIEIAESDDISVQSFIDGEGAIPTLNECHRARSAGSADAPDEASQKEGPASSGCQAPFSCSVIG